MHKTAAADLRGAQAMWVTAKSISSPPNRVPLLRVLDRNVISIAAVHTRGERAQQDPGTSGGTALEGAHNALVESFIPIFSGLSSITPKFMATWNLRLSPYLEIGSSQM